MISRTSTQKAFLIIACLLLFTLPLSRQISLILFVIAVVLPLITGYAKPNFKILLSNKILGASALFFIITAVSLAYTANLDHGFKQIISKAPFLLVPFFITSKLFSEADELNFKKSFVWGNTLAVIYCIINGYLNYKNTGQTYFFYYQYFSELIHSSYFAIFLTLAIGFILFTPNLLQRKIYWVFLLVLFTGIVLLVSRSGYLGLAGIILLFAIYQIISKKNRLALYVIIFFVTTGAIFALSLPDVKTRIEEGMHGTVIKDPSSENNTFFIRTTIWKTSLDLIREHPVAGVGTGDAVDALNKELAKGPLKAQYSAVHLNSHNQFIETLLANGLIGGICLITLIALIIYHGVLKQDFLQISFGLMILIHFCFESMLETQAGVFFFTIFTCFLFSQKREA